MAMRAPEGLVLGGSDEAGFEVAFSDSLTDGGNLRHPVPVHCEVF